MRILVTGANGQLGQQLRALYHNNGWQWVWADKAMLNIIDKDACDKIIGEGNFDYCINLAAYTAVDEAESEIEKAYAINGTGAQNIGIACRDNKVKLIHISTEYVYNNGFDRPYLEEDPTNCQGIYAKSKKIGEMNLVLNYPEVIILRTSWIYSDYGQNFYKTIRRLLEAGKDLRVVNDQIGAPTYAGDICEAIVQIIHKIEEKKGYTPPTGFFNFANEGECSWYEFAQAIAANLNIAANITPVPSIEYPTPAPRPKYSVMDLKKIQTTFGLKTRHWKDVFDDFLH